MAELNDELIAGLKLCKSKELSFAFVGPESNGMLVLAPKPGAKVPKNDIDDAKKKIKSTALVLGKCTGPIGAMVFKVKKPKPTLAQAIKKAVFRDTKLTVKAEIQQLILQAGEADDFGDEDAGAPGVAQAGAGAPGVAAKPPAGAAAGAAAGVPPAAPPAPPGDKAAVMALQTSLKDAGCDPGTIDGIIGKNTIAAIKKFQTAKGLPVTGKADAATKAALAGAPKGEAGGAAAPAADAAAGGGTATDGISKKTPPGKPASLDFSKWHSARQDAITGLKALAGKIFDTGHDSRKGVINEIQEIIKRLYANPSVKQIGELEKFLEDDDTLKAVEESPPQFHVVKIRKPLQDALKTLKV